LEADEASRPGPASTSEDVIQADKVKAVEARGTLPKVIEVVHGGYVCQCAECMAAEEVLERNPSVRDLAYKGFEKDAMLGLLKAAKVEVKKQLANL